MWFWYVKRHAHSRILDCEADKTIPVVQEEPNTDIEWGGEYGELVPRLSVKKWDWWMSEVIPSKKSVQTNSVSMRTKPVAYSDMA